MSIYLFDLLLLVVVPEEDGGAEDGGEEEQGQQQHPGHLLVYNRLRIEQMVQQGRPCSFVPKFVLNNHNREISPTNQTASVYSSPLIGRHLEDRLDVDWSVVKKCVVS